MDPLRKLVSLRSKPETRDSTLSNPSHSLMTSLSGGSSSSGQTVNPDTALTINAVYSAVTLVSDALLTVPLRLWKDTPDGSVKACECRTWGLLTELANPEMSASELYEVAVGHLCLYGNAYLLKDRDENGLVTELWPVQPAQVSVGRVKGVKTYKVDNNTGKAWVGTDRDILHIKGFSKEGLVGISPIYTAKNYLGRTLAQDDFNARWFANQATPSGILKAPKEMEPEDVKKTRSEWEAMHRGSKNAAKIAILTEGVEFEPMTMSFGDMQFIEQSKFSVQDIARLYRIPAPMLGESGGDSLTYATTEMANTEFIRRAVMPIAKRIELALKRDGDLIMDESIVPRFDFNEYMRAVVGLADMKTRAEAQKIAIEAGYKTPNEARSEESLAPIQGGDTLKQTPQSPSKLGDLEIQMPDSGPDPAGNV